MPRYRIHVADRHTGAEHDVILRAPSSSHAKTTMELRGYLVGKIERVSNRRLLATAGTAAVISALAVAFAIGYSRGRASGLREGVTRGLLFGEFNQSSPANLARRALAKQVLEAVEKSRTDLNFSWQNWIWAHDGLLNRKEVPSDLDIGYNASERELFAILHLYEPQPNPPALRSSGLSGESPSEMLTSALSKTGGDAPIPIDMDRSPAIP
jgi:hypothetical protein